MIPKKVDNCIKQFINEVNNILGKHAKKIILFGSYARGDYNDSSDIDIMILTDLSDEEILVYRNKIWDCAYEIEYDNNFDLSLSPIIKNEEKFNYWIDALPFYTNVKKEGVIISES